MTDNYGEIKAFELSSEMEDTMALAAQNMKGLLDGMISSFSLGLKQLDLKEHVLIVKELGEGGFGKVLMAEDRKTGRRMALKLQNKMRTSRHSFLMEFSISKILSSHPNIIGCAGTAFTTGDYFAFIQELAPIGDLLSLITPYVGIPEEAVKRCAVQMSNALEFIADKGLVHMDLKPENVLVFDQECHRVKLTDFGLARVKGIVVRSRVGTTSYMSPEMCGITASDELVVESTLDVWAFGVVLYILLTGEFPWQEAIPGDEAYQHFVDWQNSFQEDDPHVAWSNIPTGILTMFSDLLAIDCTKRCRSTEVLRYLSETWREEEPDSFTSQDDEDSMESCSAVQSDGLLCEASQLNTQKASSQSSVSTISSYRSTSYHLIIGTSRSEMTSEP
ncbi:serine/threonine-protein kinase SBK1-like [Mantella aurantiaca]